jgi:hypothetical protein
MPDPAQPCRPRLLAPITLGILAVAIIGYGAFATWQTLLMNRQIATMRSESQTLNKTLTALNQSSANTRDVMIDSQRAYVVFRGLTLSGASDPSDPNRPSFQVNPVWANDGNTPTRDMTIYTNPIRPILHPVMEIAMPHTPDISPGLLAPRATGMGASSFISANQLAAIRDGQLKMYIWGWVKYNDVFPNTPQHQTRFCLIVNTFQGDPNVPGEAAVGGPPCGQAGDHYECTDQECGPQP